MGYGRPVYEKDAESSQAKPSGSASAGGSISSSSASSGNASAGSSPSTSSPDKPSSSAGYYKKYTGKSERIDDVFKAVGVPAKFRDTYMKRKPVASKNGISNYKGSATQNLKLVKLAKAGSLRRYSFIDFFAAPVVANAVSICYNFFCDGKLQLTV